METRFIPLLRSTSLAAAIALGAAAPAKAAIVVSLDPVTQNIAVGGTAFVNLNITGMDANVAPSLGAWMADIAYDSSVVSASGVMFGSHLTLGVLNSTRFADFSVPGSISALETSNELSAQLNAAQPDAFTLATFSFDGIAPGVVGLSFTLLQLSDETGHPVNTFTAKTASITVVSPTVPDAGSSLASLAACLGLILFGHHWRVRGAPR